MAKTIINEDGNITEQHMLLQEGAIHFTTRRGIFKFNKFQTEIQFLEYYLHLSWKDSNN